MRKPFLALLLLLLLSPLFPAAAVAPKKPKLILAIVIDQFRYDYLTRFSTDYNSGLSYLLKKGAVFTNAHHIAAPTVTAIGHSTFLSGATPSLSGIAGNEWFDRAAGKIVTSVADDQTKLIGGPSDRPGSSPRRLLVSTLGDEIKMHGEESTVIGISIKDRSAILPVGHMADAAYWFDPDSNHWVTSTYYRAELPEWVEKLNTQEPAKKYAGASWLPFDAKAGAKPFCTMADRSDVPKCRSLEAAPWGNELIEEMAERAVTAEKLGRHSGTDLLAVSFSSNDYVGHAKGPDSPEVRDISIRTDRLLGKFLDFMNAQVGAANIVLVMTADHGVAPVPEVNQARKMPGGRLSKAALLSKVQDALAAKYGPGKWVIANSTAALYLNTELIENKKLRKKDLEDTAAEALLTLPHAFRVYTGDQIAHGAVRQDWITQIVSNGYFPQRSGDVFFIADPFFLYEESGASHGTPFNYDTHVPIIFVGPNIKPGSYDGQIAVNDIAPTLANILGVQFPSGSVGRVLSEMYEK